MFSPTHPYLLPITSSFFQCQVPNPTLSEASLAPLPFLPFHPNSMILPLGYTTTLPFPQDSTPHFLPRPVPPGATYPPSSPHTSGLWPRLPSPPPPQGRRREEGKRGGTPQGKDDLPLVLIAANLSFLFSYWSALAHAPPSSSDRARPPPQRPRPTQPRRGDPGLGDWD